MNYSELKDKFVDSLNYDNEESDRAVRTYLGILRDVEEEKQKDLCDFDKEEIIRSVIDRCNEGASTVSVFFSLIVRYVNWCVDNGYSKRTDKISISHDDYAPYVDKEFYYTEIDIYSFCQRLNNPVHKYLVAAPFFGISNRDDYDELYGIRNEDVKILNEETSVLSLGEREIRVPTWFAKIVSESINTYVFEQANGVKVNMIGKGPIKVPVYKKGEVDDPGRHFQVYNMYRRPIRNALRDKDISYVKLRNSGIVYRTKIIMAKYKKTSLRDVMKLKEYHEDVIERFRIENLNNFVRAFRVYVDIKYI